MLPWPRVKHLQLFETIFDLISEMEVCCAPPRNALSKFACSHARPHTAAGLPLPLSPPTTVNRWPPLKVIYSARVAFAVGRAESSRLQIRVKGIKMIESRVSSPVRPFARSPGEICIFLLAHEFAIASAIIFNVSPIALTSSSSGPSPLLLALSAPRIINISYLSLISSNGCGKGRGGGQECRGAHRGRKAHLNKPAN